MIIAALFSLAELLNQAKCPSRNEWTIKMSWSFQPKKRLKSCHWKSIDRVGAVVWLITHWKPCVQALATAHGALGDVRALEDEAGGKSLDPCSTPL